MSAMRGALFYALFYGGMLVVGAVMAPVALASARGARWVAKTFFRGSLVALRLVCGLRVRIDGAVPDGPVIVAAKHQTMLDVIALFATLPEAHFVMKRELTRAPVFGWYARRVGTVAVDRGAGRDAVRTMVAEMTAGERGGQMVIFPQGTRVPPGRSAPYKAGVHALYEATGRTVIPAAANLGAFMPRGMGIRPGVAAIAFLDPIAPGLARGPFMAILEREIERETARLSARAG